MKEDELIQLEDGTEVAVTTQWGYYKSKDSYEIDEVFDSFRNYLKTLGYDIQEYES